MDGLPVLSAGEAEAFAATALANIAEVYPHKLDHVMSSAADVQLPRTLHPAFHGSYDWHSCVHMHWLLVHLRRRFPLLAARAEVAAALGRNLAPGAIAAECDYLARPHTQTFERTYGWAWLLKLATELRACSDDAALRWRSALQPLVDAIVARYLAYLPRARYPIRHGMHANSAFGLAFALDYARSEGVPALEDACRLAADRWFASDRDAPAAWEPSGADFLSPALMEAELMRRHLDAPAFASWLDAWLPGLARGLPSPLLSPVIVDDRSDPQIVHLDGLNLSRAWCWRGIAAALPLNDARRERATQAARVHIDAGRVAVVTGDFVGTHWLASFAALALDDVN